MLKMDTSKYRKLKGNTAKCQMIMIVLRFKRRKAMFLADYAQNVGIIRKG